MGKEWFYEWFDENYLHLYQHRDMKDACCQFDLIIKEISPGKDWKILDLACGEGRHTSLFRAKGYDIKGVDLSDTLIKSGREKFPGLDLVQCDMRDIRGKYDLVLSLFTSFGYFEHEEEDRKVVSGVYRSLNPGGFFWFDFFNSEHIRRNLVPENTVLLDNGVEVIEERRIRGNRINKRICFRNGSGLKEYSESVRMYSKFELVEMMDTIGFKVEKRFGDYTGSEWCENSERVILLCKKPR